MQCRNTSKYPSVSPSPSHARFDALINGSPDTLPLPALQVHKTGCTVDQRILHA
jgi:hypothetical protein